MFLQGPATHSWPAACSRSSAPRRRPGSRRAPCSPSATSGPQRGGSRRQLKNNNFNDFLASTTATISATELFI